MFVVQHPGKQRLLVFPANCHRTLKLLRTQCLDTAFKSRGLCSLGWKFCNVAGGHANLAFREYEDLKPYKKKSCISVFSADLQDNSFTISAVKGNSRAEASDSTSALQPSGNDNTADKQTLPAMHYTSEHADSEPNPQAPLGIAAATTESPALQRPVAHTASQTSPKKCSNNQ